MDNDLDIFRRREERKKKKKVKQVDYPKYNDEKVCEYRNRYLSASSNSKDLSEGR